jgi:hypothetical protein
VGSLALIATQLADAGVDIARLEVVAADGTTAIDDLLVRGDGAEQIIARAHPEIRVLAVREHAQLPDPGLAMAAACEAIAHADGLAAARMALVRAALDLAGADRGLLLRDAERGTLRGVASTVGDVGEIRARDFPLAARVLASGEPESATGDMDWTPAGLRTQLAGGASLTLALGEPGCLVLCLVRADWFPFVSAEIDRLRALMRVAWGILRANGERPPAIDERSPAGAQLA